MTASARLKKSVRPYNWNGRTVFIIRHREDGNVVVSEIPNGNVCDVAPYDELELLLSHAKPLINKMSDNRAKENKVYLTLRKVFLDNHKLCEANLKGCTKKAMTVHHAAGRVGKRLIDVKTFVALCGSCHIWVENNPEEAKEIGLSINRL